MHSTHPTKVFFAHQTIPPSDPGWPAGMTTVHCFQTVLSIDASVRRVGNGIFTVAHVQRGI
jgi:hypothetical protein